MTRSAIALLALAIVMTPAAARAAFPIDHPVRQPNPLDQDYAVVASGPDGYLVAWRSERPIGYGVFVARVDAAGSVLDPYGIELGNASSVAPGIDPEAYYRMAVAWDGTSYLVVWRDGPIFGRTVSPAGALGPLLTLGLPGDGVLRWPTVACSGNECLAAWWWYDVETGHRVRLARVAGETVTHTDVPVTSAAGDQHEPSIAWDGESFLVAWRDIRRPDGGDIYATFVSPAGAVQDDVGIPVSVADGTEDQVAISWNGAHHMLVWRDSRSGQAELYAGRVTAGGDVQDPGGIALAGTAGAEYPALAWNGIEHALAWSTTGSYVSHLSTSGALDPAPVQLTTYTPRPAVAPLGSEFVVAWADRVMYDLDVFTQRLVESGLAPGGPDSEYVAGIPSAEWAPAAASDGEKHLLVWTDTRHGARALYGTRISADGVVLDGDGFAISAEPPSESYGAAVAWDGSSYLVVWSREAENGYVWLVAARVSPEGVVLDEIPTVIDGPLTSTRPATPSVVWNGTAFFVVWLGMADLTHTVIKGARVSASGTLVDETPIEISHAIDDARYPALAWNGQVHLVVWEHTEYLPWKIHGARVSAAGVVLDDEDLDFSDFFGGLGPAVAGHAGGFLVAYNDDYSIQEGPIQIRLADEDGLPLGEPIEIGGYSGRRTKVVWDGSGYSVIWANDDVRVLRVSASGAPIYPWATIPLPPESGTEPWDKPAVASAGDGHIAVFFSQFFSSDSLEQRYREAHLYGETFRGALNGEPCGDANECSSGTCEGEVCCDRPCPDGSCATGTCTLPTPDAGPPLVDAGSGTGSSSGGGGACHVAGMSGRSAPRTASGLLLLAALVMAAVRARRSGGDQRVGRGRAR